MADIVGRPESVAAPGIVRSFLDRPVLWTWLLLCAVFSACWFVGVSPNGDFDDLLKFQKLRSFLDSDLWFDSVVSGVLQPEPFHSHWVRILDVPYALFAWLIEPLAGQPTALTVTTFLVPLLLLLPALACYRKIVGAFGFEQPGIAFIFIVLLAMRAFFEFAPGRIDYHNVQILFLLASITLTLSASDRAAAANGALIALALATSVEFALPFALTMAIYAAEFISGRDGASRRLGLFGAGLVVVPLLVYPAVVAPVDYGTAACDTYSAPQLLALVIAGASFTAAGVIGGRRQLAPGRTGGPSTTSRSAEPSRILARGLLIAIPAAAGVALLVHLFPECLAGPYAGLGGYLRDTWLLDIRQERSFLSRPDFVLSFDIAGAAVMFVGGTATAVMVAAGGCRDRRFVVMALFALVAVAQALLYFRYLRYLPLFAGPGVLFAVAATVPGLRTGGLIVSGFSRAIPSSIAMLAPGVLLAAALVVFHLSAPASAGAGTAASFAGSCLFDELDVHGWPRGARIMAPPDVGIRLLPDIADAAVIAVPFHTGVPGLQRSYRFLDPTTGDPRAVLDESQATHVAICAWRSEPSAALERRYPFAAGLMEGGAPDWLVECPTGSSTPLRIYRYPSRPGGQSCPTDGGSKL